MNQFAGVLNNATEAVAAALNTQTKGIPVVVFNPLNIAREDLVEASVNFPGGMPKAVHVTAPDGREVPAQISNGKVLFVAKVPSVGYAVYDVQPGAGAAAAAPGLRASQDSIENQYYRVKLNADGDVASILDKSIGEELLAAPVRLAISYDNPEQWPAWNMDWDQEQAEPKAYVSGPARIRVTENGPARVAVEVSRETAVQVCPDDPPFVRRRGKTRRVRKRNRLEHPRVELEGHVPARSFESVGYVQLGYWHDRPAHRGAEEVRGAVAPVDRPNRHEQRVWRDHSDRLQERIGQAERPYHPPDADPHAGTRGGYTDQGTQDLGHHEFVYGIAGHAADWRHAETDWQGQRLNDPLIAFETSRHAGARAGVFSVKGQ